MPSTPSDALSRHQGSRPPGVLGRLLGANVTLYLGMSRLAVSYLQDLVDSLQAEDLTPELSTRDIDALLEQLKPQQRQIVRSISLNGYSIRETADRLHMTEGAVRVTLHRALKALAVCYRSSASED